MFNSYKHSTQALCKILFQLLTAATDEGLMPAVQTCKVGQAMLVVVIHVNDINIGTNIPLIMHKEHTLLYTNFTLVTYRMLYNSLSVCVYLFSLSNNMAHNYSAINKHNIYFPNYVTCHAQQNLTMFRWLCVYDYEFVYIIK